MENLKNVILAIEIPIKLLEVVPKIEGINEFIHHFLEKECDEKLASATVFLPDIITAMIEKNLTLEEAIKLNKLNTKEKQEQIKKTLQLLKYEEIKGFVKLFVNVLSKVKQDAEKCKKIVVPISNISNAFYNMLVKTNIIQNAEEMEKDKKIREMIEKKLLDPIKQEIKNTLEEKEKVEYYNKILTFFNSSIDLSYINVPIQSTISMKLEQAIENDTTFEQADIDFEVATQKLIHDLSVLDTEKICAEFKLLVIQELEFI